MRPSKGSKGASLGPHLQPGAMGRGGVERQCYFGSPHCYPAASPSLWSYLLTLLLARKLGLGGCMVPQLVLASVLGNVSSQQIQGGDHFQRPLEKQWQGTHGTSSAGGTRWCQRWTLGLLCSTH